MIGACLPRFLMAITGQILIFNLVKVIGVGFGVLQTDLQNKISA